MTFYIFGTKKGVLEASGARQKKFASRPTSRRTREYFRSRSILFWPSGRRAARVFSRRRARGKNCGAEGARFSAF
jgi:hypothetical protein